jgi:hypothetical protein
MEKDITPYNSQSTVVGLMARIVLPLQQASLEGTTYSHDQNKNIGKQ